MGMLLAAGGRWPSPKEEALNLARYVRPAVILRDIVLSATARMLSLGYCPESSSAWITPHQSGDKLLGKKGP